PLPPRGRGGDALSAALAPGGHAVLLVARWREGEPGRAGAAREGPEGDEARPRGGPAAVAEARRGAGEPLPVPLARPPDGAGGRHLRPATLAEQQAVPPGPPAAPRGTGGRRHRLRHGARPLAEHRRGHEAALGGVARAGLCPGGGAVARRRPAQEERA